MWLLQSTNEVFHDKHGAFAGVLQKAFRLFLFEQWKRIVLARNVSIDHLMQCNSHDNRETDQQIVQIQRDGNFYLFLENGRELVMVQSPISGLCLAYVLSKADIFGNVRQLSTILYVALAFIAILGALLITVLSFWNARPIREILYLTERLSPDETTTAEGAALDRIRTILIQLYTDREALPPALEPMPFPDQEEMPEPTEDDLLLEKEDETMPVSDQESRQGESVLVRQAMAFIDQHQEDGNLNVSMLADT